MPEFLMYFCSPASTGRTYAHTTTNSSVTSHARPRRILAEFDHINNILGFDFQNRRTGRRQRNARKAL